MEKDVSRLSPTDVATLTSPRYGWETNHLHMAAQWDFKRAVCGHDFFSSARAYSLWNAITLHASEEVSCAVCPAALLGLPNSGTLMAILNTSPSINSGSEPPYARLYFIIAENSSTRMIKKLTSIDCLLIDEFGYAALEK